MKLLAPAEPQKIFAVGRNYRSHLGTRPAPEQPEIFWKPVSALQNPGDPIRLPRESTDVHFEGELVLVIGRSGKHLSPAEARQVIFGVTCGNDVSERQWQAGPKKDLQWWRAKGSDTFAPCGPVDRHRPRPRSACRCRRGSTARWCSSRAPRTCCSTAPPSSASSAASSRWRPGDLIYTGTPGNTRALRPGDVVEVELEGVGLLRNPVASD